MKSFLVLIVTTLSVSAFAQCGDYFFDLLARDFYYSDFYDESSAPYLDSFYQGRPMREDARYHENLEERTPYFTEGRDYDSVDSRYEDSESTPYFYDGPSDTDF